MKKILSAITLSAAALLGFANQASADVPSGSDANQEATWVTYIHDTYGITAECFKHEGQGQTVHGTATAKTVVLAPFGDDWYGTAYALLVVKAGTGNLVTYQPTAGTVYLTPEGKDISHWIVCKGEFPPPTSTTVPVTTTKVVPTTTQAQQDLTPPPASTTTVDLCARIRVYFTENPTAPKVDGWDYQCAPEIMDAPVVILDPQVETKVLAFTGTETRDRAAAAFGLIGVGAMIVLAGRRFGKDLKVVG